MITPALSETRPRTGGRPAGRRFAVLALTTAIVFSSAGAAVVATVGTATAAAAAATGYPTTPPAAVCGNTTLLGGPTAPPVGAVVVNPGTDLHGVTLGHAAGTTFWLAPGTHILGDDQFNQVIPKDGNVYVGAPGAILDGRRINRYAFTSTAAGVQIRHLTIRNFVAPLNEGVVNHDSGSGWTVELNTITGNDGAGLFVGSNNLVRSNCLADNGQYGFSVFAYGGVDDVTITGNEVKGNNTGDWEAASPGCGCAGASKFWEVDGAVVTGNWIHHNKGPGLWADTNDIGFLIEGNYINDNDDEGIFYEVAYNARIVNNTLKRNALVKGRTFAARGDNFPIGAIYLSESGGDPHVNGGVYATLEVSGNLFEDNWGGVVLWENADRFCGSAANTSAGFCTVGGSASLATCVAGTIDAAPYLSDCRWKTQNVSVAGNDFRMDKAAIGCTVGCGAQAVISNYGTFPSWSPYDGRMVQDAITFTQGNRFADNTYLGDWNFMPWEPGNLMSFSAWGSAPFSQDSGSTLNGILMGATTTSTTAVPVTTTTTVAPPTTIAPPTANALDAATSGMEASVGQWVPWFSATSASSTARAHTGTRSLLVSVTAPHGWGVTQSNWPGFVATPGAKTMSFWGRAGSGTNLGATMSVHWHDAAGLDLQTDTVSIPAVTSTWAKASASTVAPAGTARVAVDITHSSGVAGNSLHLDDIVVADGATLPSLPPVTNALDAATSGMEASVGQWVPWFSATSASSKTRAHTGTRSLLVSITAPHGWGVTQSNWPGFVATPGAKTMSFWGRAGSGTNIGATMSVHWRNAAGVDLRTDTVSITALTSTWAKASASVVAPAGTVRVAVDFTHSSGVAGNSLHLDDIAVV